MLSFIIIVAIFIAVIIGYKTGFNTGFFAIVFAYLIGAFLLGMTPKEIISGWPVSTMFVIFSVSLFYNFALANRTLEKTARWLLYAFRKAPGLLPFALYAASAGIAALGAGFFTVMAFMAPLTLLICDEAKMSKLVGAIAINCGALSRCQLYDQRKWDHLSRTYGRRRLCRPVFPLYCCHFHRKCDLFPASDRFFQIRSEKQPSDRTRCYL